MDKTVHVNVLLDLYDQLLSDRQRQVMDLYYKEDYSLNEIADLLHISKQAVSEHIKRAEAALKNYESTLGLANKTKRWNEDAEEICESLEELRQFSMDPRFQHIIDVIETRIDKEGYYDI
ncbi:MAG: sigma factor-like helix-turn-helix DNA-binding protein [Peptoniphilus sp.]|nr:sigma factor-like helix-turn-helix DNA-binding protein [Peptoniphilus sp.]MDY3119209.1 sigma factor-like helix-turn-helix DNA-binding protein [Peptoniphilus sp.]